jgi:hypothetical protein
MDERKRTTLSQLVGVQRGELHVAYAASAAV